MSNEVSTRNAFALTTFEQVESFAEKVATSGMLGPCTKAQAFVITEHCAKKGLSVLEFKQRFHTTKDGNVMIRADYLQARFQELGGKIRWIETTDKIAKAAFTYGANVDFVQEYTWEMAKRAGLTNKEVYKAHPEDLLRKNLVAKTINAICPEAKGGYYVAEEMPDEPAPAPRGEPVPVDVEVNYVTDIPSEVHEPEVIGEPEPAETADEPPKKTRKKKEPAKSEPAPVEEAEEVTPFDVKDRSGECDPNFYSICPTQYRKRDGVPFVEFPTEHLKAFLQAKHPDIEEGHRKFVNELLKTKTGE